MKKITLGIFLVAMNFSGIMLKAQPVNVAFRNLTSSDGLPVTSVTDVNQDSFGFIWIASWDGVFRYDGVNFKRIPGADGRYLETDEHGGVWISESGGNLNYYNAYLDSVKSYSFPNAKRFTDVAVDHAGFVWAATGRGIFTYNVKKDSFLLDPGQRMGRIYFPSAQNERLLFLCRMENDETIKIGLRSQQGDYSYYDTPMDNNNPDKGKFFTEIYSSALLPYGEKGILILNDYGWAISEDGKEWDFRTADHPEAMRDRSNTILDSDGNLWLNQQNAVSKIDAKSGKSIIYKHNPTDWNSILPLENVGAGSDMFIDRQGILWIARFANGISRMNLYEGDFGLLVDKNGKPIKEVLSAIELNDGSFYVGSRFRGSNLVHYDAQWNKINQYETYSRESPPGKSFSKELSHPYPWSLGLSSDGSLWVGTGSPGPNRGGLNRIRPNSDQITRFKFDPKDQSSINSNWIFKIFIDGSDRVWCWGGNKICSIDPTTEQITRGLAFPPRTSGIDTVNKEFYFPELVNSNGDLIIKNSLDQHHYIVDHVSQETVPFGIAPDNHPDLDYLLQDEKDHIWFRTDRRIGYLDPTFQKIEKSYAYNSFEFPATEINAMQSDKSGMIWLGTDMGIFQFDPATEHFEHFSFDRGLQGNYYEFSLNYRGPSGKIYFGGDGGLNIIDPDRIKSNPYPPDMVFTSLRIDGNFITPGPNSAIHQPLNSASEIVVQPNNSVFTLTFAAIHFAGFRDNKYQYKLEGFDKDWLDGGTAGSATYTSLLPGKYIFRIKGSNWDGVWSDGNKSILIHILPPWWMTTYAYVIYFFLLIGLFYAAHKIQSRRVIVRERERAREKELVQAREIEKAYTELKSTQAQLIHSEKMASLGELTAGIAHEIQNPLNFVNNFSDVSNELIDELKIERSKPKSQREDKLEDEIIQDVGQNLQKIKHHGERASEIVKSMLQHSRNTTGEKELTDINALCDEYLRLSYHGFRAKDKSFHAEYKLELDDNLPEVNVIPQDIGRVLLNLINNAFQAVSTESRHRRETASSSYNPEVNVSTKMLDGQIEIQITDNGPGIPEQVRDKIFQPFFTTKPTGQGTGLGLSLSYDIVKAHGGEIKVESKEGEGTGFIIQIPTN